MYKSLSEIAKNKGFTRQYLSQLCKKNSVNKNEDGLYLVDDIERILKNSNPLKSLNEKNKKVKEIESFDDKSEEDFDEFYNIDDIKDLIKNLNGKDYIEVKTEKEKILTAKAKLEFDKLNNSLISVEKVKLISFEVSKRFKENILTISNRVSNLIAGESNPKVIKDIIDEEIKKVLKDIQKDLKDLYDKQ